jgi:dephospho-CoA kinase
MSAFDYPCVALYGASREAAGVSDSVGGTRSVAQRGEANVPFNKPMVIGITGGIASGKSSVAAMFSGRGIIHVDADKMVHYLLQHDRSMIAEIAAAFPDAVVPPPRGGINRAALAAHISAHPEALVTLERIIHPHVRRAELAAIQSAARNRLRAVVLDIPLMYETGADALCDVVIAAHAPLDHRRRRAFARQGMTHEKFQRLVARQWADADRNALADIVIPTTIGKAATRRCVTALMVEWGLK